NFGIKMPPVKRIMLQSRLHKRLRFLNMADFGEYIDYLFSAEGRKNEVTEMMNVVSTNKTDFFREPAHFEFMENHVLPKFEIERPTRQIKIWSAGCSSGEEVYTICITLEEYMRLKKDLSYHVFGTDISTDVLRKAKSAIYSNDRTAGISHEHKKRYFLISKDRSTNLVKVIPKLRNKVSFSRLNFMDKHYNVDSGFDIIFCRNVLIYFDRETQEKVINRLCQKLDIGGYLFLGHSESITGLNVPLKQLQPTVYQKI
ncbi:MAG: chemotaxis protein CheR, partial [Cyclobacteriaceae bacterium]|nr:chemotaxis protein CheR [Cyclobacteriaceae bacterium]